MADFRVSPIDIGVLIVYLVLSRMIPLWPNRSQKGNTDGFFLGERKFV